MPWIVSLYMTKNIGIGTQPRLDPGGSTLDRQDETTPRLRMPGMIRTEGEPLNNILRVIYVWDKPRQRYRRIGNRVRAVRCQAHAGA